MINTLVWDGETLAITKFPDDKTKRLRTPGRSVVWNLFGERVLGYGFIGDPVVATLFEDMLMGKDFVVQSKEVQDTKNPPKGEINAIVILKNKIANLVVYSIKDGTLNVGVVPSVGRTAIGAKEVIAKGCLSVGANATKTICSCINQSGLLKDNLITKSF